MMILYLHGFSSAAGSNKAAVIREMLADTHFVIADYPSHRPHAAVHTLAALIGQVAARHPDEGVTLIGSSLGGFYARYLGETEPGVTGVVLINPALQPQLTLAPSIGGNINFVTGKPFEFSRRDHEALAAYHLQRLNRSVPALVLLDEEDEVIDSSVAAQRYAKDGRVVCYPGGSHRFEHLAEAVAEIRTFLGLT